MNVAMTFRRIALSGSFLALLAGCGGGTARKTGLVAGKIELDGEPVSSMQVLFEDSQNGFRASALVEDGAYQFESPLVVGTYQVALLPPPAPPPTAGPPPKSDRPAVPKQYLTTADSGLTAEVQEGTNQLDFQLKP
jgi:hypothetical protein